MKRKIATAVATAALTAGITTAVAQPAYADLPAETNCFFNPLYETYENGQLSDLIRYVPAKFQPLTVTGGDGEAWHVIVEESGLDGWMPTECVAFLA